jgi:hypothetical protein
LYGFSKYGGPIVNADELTSLGEHLHGLLRAAQPDAASRLSTDTLERVAEDFLTEAAAQEWLASQMEKTRLRSLEYANGAAMELRPAEETAAMWVGICRGLLQNAPNYSETQVGLDGKIVMETRLSGSSEIFTVTVQRHGPEKLTPHEARVKAENAIFAVWRWIENANDGHGSDIGDLMSVLERRGFPAPADGE